MMNILHKSKKVKKSKNILVYLLLITFITSINTSIISTKSQNNFLDDVIAQITLPSNVEMEEEWSNIPYEMLLITPDEVGFYDAANSYAEWKTSRGIPTLVVANYSDYEGVDEPEKIRNAIISYYNQYPIEWVLLLGDTQLVPMRYVLNNDTQVMGQFEAVDPSNPNKPTDYYYAELSANWNLDNDIYWGEDVLYNDLPEENPNSLLSELDYEPEVYVGRFPADDLSELNVMMSKAIDYENATFAGDWMNQYLSVSGLLNGPKPSEDPPDLDGEHEGVICQHIIDNFIAGEMDWTHLYENTPYYTPIEDPRISPITSSNELYAINSGKSIITYGGHASPNGFSSSYNLRTSNIPTLNDNNKYSLYFAEACTTNSYDDEGSNPFGEAIFKAENKGAIGFIGSMRFSWYYPEDLKLEKVNRGIIKSFMHEMFENGYYQQGKALYESKKSYMNGSWAGSLTLYNNSWYEPDIENPGTYYYFPYYEMERKTILSYMLLGDPSLDIYTGIPKNFKSLIPSDINLTEGGRYNLYIRDNNGGLVPNARLTFQSDDGKYHYFDSNEDGLVSFSLPLGERLLNYSIFAHNKMPFRGSINVSLDLEAPILSSFQKYPELPTVSDNIEISASIKDGNFGSCEAYLVLSSNQFENFSIYHFNPLYIDFEYYIELPKLDYASYQYGILYFDYVGFYNTTFEEYGISTFEISKPLQLFVLSVGNIVIFGFAFVSLGILISKIKNPPKIKNERVFSLNDICFLSG